MRMRYTILFKLAILFVFFLPLKFFELPSAAFGLGINFSRFFIVLAVIILAMNIALDLQYWNKFHAGKYSNPYVPLLLLYFLFSTFYYYMNAAMGKVVLFGSEDFFTRSWAGRPIAQLASFFTYGIVSFYLIKKYAAEKALRTTIERTIVFCTLLLVYYGFLQQIFVHFGLPITGMNAYIGRTAGIRIGDMSLMRFYSFGGEPREFGGFIIGALFFYTYFRYGRATLFSRLNIALMIVALSLTFSTTAFLIAALSLVVILLDFLLHKKVKIKFRYPLLVAIVVAALLQTSFFSIIGDRTVRYYRIISSRIEGRATQGDLLIAQSSNFVILPYLAQIIKTPSLHLFIGYGYGSFLTGTAEILKDYFHYDIIQDARFGDTNSYLVKIFIEGGIVGTLIYGMIFFHTLRLSNKLSLFYRRSNNRDEYRKALLLRYAFIVFFIANAVQISFYYFIVMGLIVGKLNGITRSVDEESDMLKV